MAALASIVTPRRVITSVALAAAALLVVVGFQRTRDERQAGCASGVIEQVYPCPGDLLLRQGRIGIALQAGNTAVLAVDGVEIPDDQYVRGGPNQVYFTPGPGTETGALAPGPHRVIATYWPTTSDREHGSSTYAWSFSVH